MDKKKLAILGLGAVVLYFILRPKTAKAATISSGETPVTPPTNAPTNEKLVDPSTGAVLAGPSTPIASGQKYTVEKGESWSNIASRVYGDFRWWPWLWDTNRSANRFTNPDVLAVGAVIDLPVAPPVDPAYKSAIFARAKAHLDYWKSKKTNPRLAMPKSVTSPTPVA